jgi:hypothetical protein
LRQLNEGTVPTGIATLPEGWSLQDIEKWQNVWDAWLAGDPINRSRVRWVPNGVEIHKFKDDEIFQLWNQFDEWLARIICFAFGISYQGFVKEVNRATSETAERKEQEQGLGGYRLFVQRLINKLIWEHLNEPDVKFEWITDHAHNATLKLQRNVSYVQNGIVLVDEVRADEGLSPIAEVAKRFGVPIPTPGQQGGAQPHDPEAQDPNHPTEPSRPPDEDEAEDVESVNEELEAWEKKAVHDLKKGRKKFRSFQADAIPEDIKLSIESDLSKGPQTVAEIRHIFNRRKENAIRIPAPRHADGAEARTKLSAILREVGIKIKNEERP